MRRVSSGPGRLRKFPTIWNSLGWSGCERRRVPGAALATSLELSAGPCWGDTRGWSLSTSPLRRLRARTPRKVSTERRRHDARSGASAHRGAGTGQPGCLEEGADTSAHAATLSSNTRLNIAARSWPLGPRLGASFIKGTGKRRAQLPARIGRIWSRSSSRATRSKRCFGGRICTRLAAMGERSMPGLGRRCACLHQDRHRRCRVLRARGAGAAGQAHGDMAAAVVGRAPGERQAAQRPGGRQCVQDIQEHGWSKPRLHQPGRSIACSLPLTQAAGAKVGE